MQDEELVAVKALGEDTGDDLAQPVDSAGVADEDKLTHAVAETHHLLPQLHDARDGGGIGHTAVDQIPLKYAAVILHAGLIALYLRQRRHALQNICKVAEELFLVLGRGVADLRERAERRDIRKILIIAEAADVVIMRLTPDDAPRRAQRVVLRQGEGGGDIIRRAHGDIAERGTVGAVEPHEPRDDLTERAVAADTGDGVKILCVLRGEGRCLAGGGGIKKRRAEAAVVEHLERLCEALLISAAPRGGIDDEHQLFLHMRHLFQSV